MNGQERSNYVKAGLAEFDLTRHGVFTKKALEAADCFALLDRGNGYYQVNEFDLPNQAASGKPKRRMTEAIWSNF